MCMQNILTTSSVVYISVLTLGITQLGLRPHTTGSSTPEPITTTLSFFRSNQPVYTPASIRPISPCQPTRALAGPIFLTSGIPIRPFQAEFTIFTDTSTQGWGAYMGDSQISGTWTHSEASSISTVCNS